MFQSEHLVEKWKPLLDHEGGIQDAHRKAVTAVLLENQEKFLREEEAFAQGHSLMESPTNSGNAAGTQGGYSSDAAAGGPVAGFDPVLISLIRRSMPNLVAYDLAGVQPMSGPTGLIFAMRSRYSSMDGTETFYDEVDTSFSGLATDAAKNTITRDHSETSAGIGTTIQAGQNPAILNPVGVNSTADYTVGQGMPTGDAEQLGDGTGWGFNEMAFSI